jgi:hypothetical protein
LGDGDRWWRPELCSSIRSMSIATAAPNADQSDQSGHAKLPSMRLDRRTLRATPLSGQTDITGPVVPYPGGTPSPVPQRGIQSP